MRKGLVVLATWICLFGCDSTTQEVRIAAQEYRFVPAVFRLVEGHPVRVTLVNEGREPHEFAGRVFTDPRVQISAIEHPQGLSPEKVLRIEPGHTARLTVQAPAGIYHFHCRMRGHGGMKGMIIVE